MKLFELDWLDLNFQNQENGLMSPDSVCANSPGDESSYRVLLYLKSINANTYNVPQAIGC